MMKMNFQLISIDDLLGCPRDRNTRTSCGHYHDVPITSTLQKMNMAVMRKDFRPQLEVRCCLENRGFRRVHENGIRFVHQVRVYQNSNRAVHCCCAICTDAESFLENRGGERRNCHVAGRKR